jgi:hypothetical protein
MACNRDLFSIDIFHFNPFSTVKVALSLTTKHFCDNYRSTQKVSSHIRTKPSRRVNTASTSMVFSVSINCFDPFMPRPTSRASFGCSSAFEGMQAQNGQSPPNSSSSIIKLERPPSAVLAARFRPASPEPMTTRSKTYSFES